MVLFNGSLLSDTINGLFSGFAEPLGVKTSAARRKLEIFLPLSGQDALGANFPTQGSLMGTFLMIAVEFNLAPTRVHLTPKLI